jgi:hypothetical protein
MAMIEVPGKVCAGHGVASGRSANQPHNPYPAGTIAMQMPFFKALGLNLSACFAGTINLDIAPKQWQLLQADHCFEHLRWTHLHPPETFSFVALQVVWQSRPVQGWLYSPHPETKAAHFQSRAIIELLLPKLDGLKVGDSLSVCVSPSQLRLIESV